MRRTRALVTPQSRSGCYTCKKRKVKCDEYQPACLRCLKAGRICDGYPAERDSVSLQSTNLINAENLSDNNFRERWLRAIGGTGFDRPGSNALQQILSSSPGYLASAVPALQALEALQDFGSLQGTAQNPTSRTLIDDFYGLAVQTLSKELSASQCSSKLVFVSSMLLLAIELLQRRRQNGLRHSIGAIEPWLSSRSPGFDDSSMIHLYRIRDLQCLIYSQGVTLPRMTDVRGITFNDGTSLNVLDVEHRCIEALHYAQSFIARVHHDTVLNDSLSHESEVSGHVRLLETAQGVVDTALTKSGDAPITSIFLVLQNLLIMTILQLKQLYASCESQWDCHLEEFSSILTNVDALQALPKVDRMDTRSFTLLLGVIPPLQMVAIKCRHFSVRVQAIMLLEQANQEGPFIGSQLAAVATTCMEIEGQLPCQGSAKTALQLRHSSSSTSQYSEELPAEDLRLSDCTLLEHNGQVDEANLLRPYRGHTKIRLLRRRKPCHLIQARVLTSSTFRTAPEFRHLQNEEVDLSTWEKWTETIRFGPPSLNILVRVVTKTNDQ